VAHIDLHARLCDVTPRGRSINLSDGIVRLTNAAADTPHAVEFDLSPIAHTFLRGHRIRLQVSGGAHPCYGRNHGTAEPYATSTRLQASHRTVLHDAQPTPLQRVATRVPLTAGGWPAARLYTPDGRSDPNAART
jgi:predicted acyl esterase